MQSIVIDTETTSKYPAQARVIQLGTSVCDEGGEVRTGQTWINPGTPVPDDVVKAIGLTPDELEAIRCARPFASVAQGLCDGMVKRGLVVGYNLLTFDKPILERELKRCKLEWPDVRVLDVMVMARHLLVNEGLADYQLKTVAQYFGCLLDGAHRAEADCQMTRAVWRNLAPALPQDVDELLAWQALRAPLGGLWAMLEDGSLRLNCTSKDNVALKRGMTQEEVYTLSEGFYEWTMRKLPGGGNAYRLMPF